MDSLRNRSPCAWRCLMLAGAIGLAAAGTGHGAEPMVAGTSTTTISPARAEGNGSPNGLPNGPPNGSPTGQHDFDFEFGAWRVTLSRLVEPLSGSSDWVDYRGTSVVRKVWDGRANLGELAVTGGSGAIQGLSLRLYNPETGRWNISWASSRDGVIGPPMSGRFEDDGRGVFYGEELYEGRAIFVRFVFSHVTADSFRFEQAFSEDGGETWEPNWVARFTRESGLPAGTPAEPDS